MKKVVKKSASKMQAGGKVEEQSMKQKALGRTSKQAEMNKIKTSLKKAKSGGSFPDLNKDGKITKADVLVGRGVIKAKKGKSVKKAQLGGLVDKLAGGIGKKAGGFSGIKDMFGNSGFGGRGLMGAIGGLLARRKKKQAEAQPAAQPAMKKGGKLKKQAAVAIAMKKAGKTPKTMKSGGKMGKCRYGCN